MNREEMALAVMEGGLSQSQAALKFAAPAKVVNRWVERYKAEGRAGMPTARRGPGAVRMRVNGLWPIGSLRCGASASRASTLQVGSLSRREGEPGAGAGRTVAAEGR